MGKRVEITANNVKVDGSDRMVLWGEASHKDCKGKIVCVESNSMFPMHSNIKSKVRVEVDKLQVDVVEVDAGQAIPEELCQETSIGVSKVGAAAESIVHFFVRTNREKPELLMDILAGREGRGPRQGLTLVFVENRPTANALTAMLRDNGFGVTTIHGGLSTSEPPWNEQTPYLVATDAHLVPWLDIEHVINYDLPVDTDQLAHRIGCAGRNGAATSLTSLVNKHEDCHVAPMLVSLLRDAGHFY